MRRPRVSARAAVVGVVLVLLSLPAAALAQQATVSVRVAPFGWRSSTPLFNVRIEESSDDRRLRLPSLTLTNTRSGPELTNLALALPDVAIGRAAVTSRFGDQHLPPTFLSSPLSGSSVHWPMRGLNVSTTGAAPLTLSVGKLDAQAGTGMTAADAPAVLAVALSLSPHERLSVGPRLLVPAGARALQASAGTAIRAEVLPHLSLVGDVGAAESTRGGWAPLASAGVVSRWRTTELETSVLRGAPSSATEDAPTVRSVDRELARGQMQALPGLTIAGRASRSRPASALNTGNTSLGALAIAYDRFPYGRLAATQERQVTPSQALDTTRVEWRPPVLSGVAVRYVTTRQTRRDAGTLPSTLIEVDLPSLTARRPGSRLRLGAALTANTRSDLPALASRVSGRFDVVENVTLTGDTEIQLAREDGAQLLKTLRVTTDVGVLEATVLQLRYAYRAGAPFSLNQGFEARISRSVSLSPW
jgi:hypothetical protein